MKATTGSSTNACAKTAGAEAAKKVKNGLEQIQMAFVYASCDYDLDDMLASRMSFQEFQLSGTHHSPALSPRRGLSAAMTDLSESWG